MRRGIACVVLLVITSALSYGQNLEWESIPMPYGANVRLVHEHSSGDLIVYTNADEDVHPKSTSNVVDRVYRSSPPFTHWESVNIPSFVRQYIETDAGTVYALVADEIHLSRDSGRSWHAAVTGIKIGSIAARGNTIVAVGMNDTLVYSTDDGQSWGFLASGLGDQFLYEDGGVYLDPDMRLYVVSAYGSAFRSESWMQEPVQWDTVYTKAMKIFAFPDSSLCLFTWDRGVVRSADHGDTWSVYANGSEDALYYAHLTSLGDVFSTRRETIDYPGKGYTNQYYIMRYPYNGTAWEDVRECTAANGPEPYSIGENFYVSTNGNLLMSSDMGTVWQDITGDLALYPYSRVQRAADGALILNGKFGNYRSSPSGAAWTRQPFYAVQSCTGPANEVYALYDSVFVASYDGGQSYTMLTIPQNIKAIQSFACAPDGTLYLAATCTNSNTVFVSFDRGNSWDVYPAPSSPIRYIRISQDGRLYFLNGTLYRQQDGSTVFDIIPLSLTGHPVYWVVFVTNNGGMIIRSSMGVYVDSSAMSDVPFTGRTTADGWYMTYTCLAQDANNVLYANDRDGLFMTTDFGTTWTQCDDGIATKCIYDIYYDRKDNYLYATTPDGLYRTKQPVVTDITYPSHPAEMALYQNYPNPFNPTTVIRYDVPEASNVVLRVYDNLGRTVRTLTDAWHEAGSYSVEFDGTNLANGTYYYRLQAGEWTQTRQMMVLQ